MHFRPARAKTSPIMWIILGFTLAVLILPIWLSVQTLQGASGLGYDVTPTELIIRFGPKTTRIDRADIVDVTVIEEPTKGRRHFGTSMPGLKEGSWSFAETGRITLFATTTRPLTVIETPDLKWGISPDDPSAFLRAMQAEGPGGHFTPVAGQSSQEALAGVLILSLITGIGVTVLVVYTYRIARNIAYELGPDAVLIHGGRKPIRIPYTEIKGVEEANPRGVPLRTFGIGMPGLHWGSFSWTNAGPNLRLYTTRIKPLVLVSVRWRTYGITPEDAGTFITKLKQHLGSGAE